MCGAPETTTLSIIVPLYNEADSIRPLAAEISRAMAKADYNWECLWVDDGSTDEGIDILEQLSREDSHNRYISFEKNAGQSAALYAGFKAACGAVIATLDADGQNDPADVPPLVGRVMSGEADMVNGYRRIRRDGIMRKIASRIGNGFRNAFTGRTVRDVGCSTRAFRRECVCILPAFKGMHRFIPTLVSMRGFTISEVPVNHRPRTAGRSKYTSMNRLWVGISDILGIMWLRRRSFAYRIKS